MNSAGFQICTERASDGDPCATSPVRAPPPAPARRPSSPGIRYAIVPTPPRDPDLTDPRSPVPRRFSDGEAVALTVPVSFHIGDDVQGAAGTLHITTRRLVWFGDGADCAGYEVPFTSLTMHAVSRGAEDGDADFTSPCIYAQVEGTPPEGFGATIAGGGGGDDRPEEAGDDDDEETRIAASGRGSPQGRRRGLRRHVRAAHRPQGHRGSGRDVRVLCECAAMSPDDDDGNDGNDDGGFFYDEDEVMPARARGECPALDRFDEMLQIDPGVDDLIRDDPGRFEDDDDEEVK